VQQVASQAAGLPVKAVNVVTTFMGGSFGRRMDSDFVVEAVQMAKHVQRPVQSFWSRDDDMRYGAFRPANRARIRGAVNADGRIAAWSMKMAGPPMALDGVSLLYDVPNFTEEHVRVNFPANIAAWRSVGASNNGFLIESFVDELAHAAKADPVTFRLQHLSKEPRLRGVLQRAASRSGWELPLSAGRGRGVACYRSFGSYVAIVAEVTVRDTGAIKIDRVVVAADCGILVNPDAVAAQMEGSVIFALGAALLSEITFKNGLAEQANFLDYPILRYAEAPVIEVHLVESRDPPGGAGEPGVPPVAPAIANAVFAATGRRIRSLPIRLAQ
jgi:isoquinoline 1-oxidoreductase beta subunit